MTKRRSTRTSTTSVLIEEDGPSGRTRKRLQRTVMVHNTKGESTTDTDTALIEDEEQGGKKVQAATVTRVIITNKNEEHHAEPFCAQSPNRFRCRFKSTCDDCFFSSIACSHTLESRLRLLIVGHNPSTDVWKHGYSYMNPTNMLWKLLTGTLGSQHFDGVLPKDYDPYTQNSLASDHGVGIASIATVPGSDAGKIPKSVMRGWIRNFYGRLRCHVKRVQIVEQHDGYKAPLTIAFEGKRHFGLLFETEPRNVPFGRLPDDFPLPPGWPFPRDACTIWILTSSSGRAALSHAERIGPYATLAQHLRSSVQTKSEK